MRNSVADTNKVNALISLTKIYWQTGIYDTALSLGNQSKDLSEKLKYKRGLSGALNNLGITYWRQGNFPEALKNYFAALKIAEELNDKRKMGAIYGNIGNIYINQAELDEALKYELLSEKYATEKNDKKVLSNTYNSIANIYYRKASKAANIDALRDSLLSLSLKTYFIAVKINEETSNAINLAHNYNNIGLIYDAQAKVMEKKGDKAGSLRKYGEANLMYLKGLKLEMETGDRESAAGSYINLGHLQTLLGKYSMAKIYLDSALVVSKEIGNLDDLKDSYFYLHVNDSASGNYKGAYVNYKAYTLMRDSLLNEENIRQSVQVKMNYEFDKKESLAKAEQERKDALVVAESRRQKVILFSVSVVGLMMLGFALFAYRSFLQKKKANIEISHQKELIEEKQKEILDSINYASRIQRALLPNEKYIARHAGKGIKS
ncbi:MAG: tetratricopeptide repeat protein [Bacteroidia bacterium]